jgi:leucyl/phenylalanyl-tRNA--protein transferase
MRKIIFPPVESATEDGLVAIGGDLEVDTLTAAYQQGIFPWPISIEFPLAWFSPDPRGILDFSDLHLPRSFEKYLRKHAYQITFNQAFDEVIRECARIKRKGQSQTWITPEIIMGYEKLFKKSHSYSVDVWKEDKLVGGVYGVCFGEFFSGESMFSREENASKVGLYYLIKHLSDRGIKWLDTQMVTPVVESFGGKYIPRSSFLDRLKELEWTKNRELYF